MTAGGALLVGVTEGDLTPPLGVELMGYGARVGHASDVHDRLHVRALFVSAGESPDAERVLLISCELCLIAPAQGMRIRGRIADATGLRSEQILIACTHTHSGPETGLASLLAGREPPPHVQALEDAIVDAGREACRAPRPARLRIGRASAAIGRNRRIADGPLDPEVLVLAFEHADGRPLALVFQHACHPTVLGHDNLSVSADWPGVTCEALERATGAKPLFLLGAHADVDPRTRGLMDALIPGQSVGLGFEAVRVLGLEVADAVLDALRTAEDSPPTVSLRRAELGLPLHLGDLEPGAAARELERRKLELAGLLGLAPERFPRLGELYDAAAVAVRDLPLGEGRRRLALARGYLRDKTAPFFVGGARSVAVELQVIRLGEAALLALPAELTTWVGLDWKARAAKRSRYPSAVSIANGWLRYLPHPRDLAHPHADQHYEVSQSMLAPGAAVRLLEAAESLL